MTRRQVWRSVVVEAGVVGVAGGLLGVVVGVGIGALLSTLAGVPADAAVTVPWTTALVAFLQTLHPGNEQPARDAILQQRRPDDVAEGVD
jgi:predicted lysophospholipase L1 biosynthesis ABC-type transport system permease subunit